MNVLEQKIAMPTRLVCNLNPSFVDRHWKMQMDLVQFLALRAGRIRVPLENLALLTRHAKLI